MDQWEGTTSIGDDDGNLLLNTNGREIWNSRHKVIEDGEKLGENDSSTQSAITIPKPGNPNIHYVLTGFIRLSCIIVQFR